MLFLVHGSQWNVHIFDVSSELILRSKNNIETRRRRMSLNLVWQNWRSLSGAAMEWLANVREATICRTHTGANGTNTLEHINNNTNTLHTKTKLHTIRNKQAHTHTLANRHLHTGCASVSARCNNQMIRWCIQRPKSTHDQLSPCWRLLQAVLAPDNLDNNASKRFSGDRWLIWKAALWRPIVLSHSNQLTICYAMRSRLNTIWNRL